MDTDGPQCHVPTSSSVDGSPDANHGAGGRGSRSTNAECSSEAIWPIPLVVLVTTTTPSPLSISTRSPARKPGIEPPWPAYLVPSTFQTCQPSPCAVVHGWPGLSLIVCGSYISASVSADSTSAVSPPAKAAHRARSSTVVHS